MTLRIENAATGIDRLPFELWGRIVAYTGEPALLQTCRTAEKHIPLDAIWEQLCQGLKGDPWFNSHIDAVDQPGLEGKLKIKRLLRRVYVGYTPPSFGVSFFSPAFYIELSKENEKPDSYKELSKENQRMQDVSLRRAWSVLRQKLDSFPIPNRPNLPAINARLTAIRDFLNDSENPYLRYAVIDLSNCQLPAIPSEIRQFQLTTLKLNNNAIRWIRPGLFDEQKKLKVLDLSNNQLTTIANNAFYYNSELRTLILTGNPLTQGSVDELRRTLPFAILSEPLAANAAPLPLPAPVVAPLPAAASNCCVIL